ncbi:pigment-dispersing factor [Lycorma delicatula]|uniref:pigment-dispersing factor n=1 Tax=Lycorma delicatula TaxID=130591 RepID=UPI003F51011B
MRTTMIFGVLILSVALCLQCSLSAHYPDDRVLADSPLPARELFNWLYEITLRNENQHKRNSEIINSLLGLPKVLNDAGRK